jgi:hypothetical protein
LQLGRSGTQQTRHQPGHPNDDERRSPNHEPLHLPAPYTRDRRTQVPRARTPSLEPQRSATGLLLELELTGIETTGIEIAALEVTLLEITPLEITKHRIDSRRSRRIPTWWRHGFTALQSGPLSALQSGLLTAPPRGRVSALRQPQIPALGSRQVPQQGGVGR